MADRDLHNVENLLRDSVFLPSPCRHLRERVVHDAVQATHRQKVSRRAVIASASAVAFILLPLVVLQVMVSKPATVETQSSPVIAPAPAENAPATQPSYLMNPTQPVYGQSPGEALYYGRANVPGVISHPEPVGKTPGGL